MTLLQYVAVQLMGQPRSRSGSRWNWRCPACDDATAFSTLPHKPEYKDRYCCHRCGERGDVYDLLKLFFDREDFSKRRARLEALRQDYERELPTLAAQPTEPANVSSPRGGGSTDAYGRDPRQDQFCDESYAALTELMGYLAGPPTEGALRETLRLAQRALEICARYGLHPLGFAMRCAAEVSLRESLERHAAECTDPECANDCRALRGLPPLTDVERARLRRERAEQEQTEAVRRLIRKPGNNGSR